MGIKEVKGVTVRRSRLFKRFFVLTSSVILVSFVFVGSALLLLVSKFWMDEKLELLQENTVAVAQNTRDVLSSDYLGESGRGSIIVICNNLRQISNAIDADIFIANVHGDVVYCKEILQSDLAIYTGSCLVHSGYHIPAETMSLATETICVDTGTLDGTLSELSFVVSAPVIVRGETVAVVFITQSFSNGLAPYVWAIFRIFLLASLAVILASFILTYIFVARFTKPLREMSVAAKQYANGDFSSRIVVKKGYFAKQNDEVQELVVAFNSMAQSLSTLEMSRRSFVANVSHELKTPMTTIGGFIDGILDGTISEDKQTQYLKVVSDEVKRLSRLVTGMLNMSKIESGEYNLNMTSFDISQMIINTLLSFEQIIESRNLEIRGLETISQNFVKADMDMINQVVYNLIDNAVKFTPQGGYIEIFSGSDAEKNIVKIRNSGKGIEPEEADKIFERFYKVDKSRSYDTKGAGMGLFIVKTIVELHSGKIKASSVPGEYTDFIFWLPKI